MKKWSTQIRSSVIGLLSATISLAIGELSASLLSQTGPVFAVADWVKNNAPNAVVEFGKNVFGLADKPALVAGTIVLAAAIGVVLGWFSSRSPRPLQVGILAFSVLGFFAIATDPQAGVLTAFSATTLAVTAGLFSISLARLGSDTKRPSTQKIVATEEESSAGSAILQRYDRRRFFVWAGATAAVTVVAALTTTFLNAKEKVAAEREKIKTRFAIGKQPEISKEEKTVQETPDITPLIVPTKDFYRIDVALRVPQVSVETWKLRIHGLVDNELTFTYDELLDLAQDEEVTPVTLSCVSNEVGGELVGNAWWQGVPLTTLLDKAGVQEGATQIASRTAHDDFTCGFPTDIAYDGRTALLALAMNGEPLPPQHGYPARLVIAGLYGYVSATKWITEIELTTLEGFNGYWMPRGWSKDGPVKTQSRIDVPRRGRQIQAGQPTPIAGVAWAPNTGIEKVEIRIDEGEWQEANLGPSLGKNAWSQWRFDWEKPTAGRHDIACRATDKSGSTQTEELALPAPDGATGWHTVNIEVA